MSEAARAVPATVPNHASPSRGVTPGLPTNPGSFKAAEKPTAGVDLDPWAGAVATIAPAAPVYNQWTHLPHYGDNAEEIICPECAGSGEIATSASPDPQMLTSGTCYVCDGYGMVTPEALDAEFNRLYDAVIEGELSVPPRWAEAKINQILAEQETAFGGHAPGEDQPPF